MTLENTFDEQAAFWNRNAKQYAAKPIDDMAAYEAKLDSVKKHLSLTDRVLEMGCGTGGTAIRLAPFVEHWTGADFSTEMISIAQSKSAPSNVNFVLAEANTKLDGSPFDAICAFSLIHLVPDIDETLAAIHRQLKPGGLFISNTVCLGDKGLHMKLLVRFIQLVKRLKTLNIISKDELVEKMTANGFEIADIRYLSKKSMSPYIIARKMRG